MSASGYNCYRCGAWVMEAQTHSCVGSFLTALPSDAERDYTDGTPMPAQPAEVQEAYKAYHKARDQFERLYRVWAAEEDRKE